MCEEWVAEDLQPYFGLPSTPLSSSDSNFFSPPPPIQVSRLQVVKIPKEVETLKPYYFVLEEKNLAGSEVTLKRTEIFASKGGYSNPRKCPHRSDSNPSNHLYLDIITSHDENNSCCEQFPNCLSEGKDRAVPEMYFATLNVPGWGLRFDERGQLRLHMIFACKPRCFKQSIPCISFKLTLQSSEESGFGNATQSWITDPIPLVDCFKRGKRKRQSDEDSSRKKINSQVSLLHDQPLIIPERFYIIAVNKEFGIPVEISQPCCIIVRVTNTNSEFKESYNFSQCGSYNIPWSSNRTGLFELQFEIPSCSSITITLLVASPERVEQMKEEWKIWTKCGGDFNKVNSNTLLSTMISILEPLFSDDHKLATEYATNILKAKVGEAHQVLTSEFFSWNPSSFGLWDFFDGIVKALQTDTDICRLAKKRWIAVLTREAANENLKDQPVGSCILRFSTTEKNYIALQYSGNRKPGRIHIQELFQQGKKLSSLISGSDKCEGVERVACSTSTGFQFLPKKNLIEYVDIPL